MYKGRGEGWGEFRLGYVLRWRRVKNGSGDFPKGVQLSTLIQLSRELSGGFSGRVVVEISG